MENNDVCAVIVTHHPDVAEVETLISRIVGHVGLIVIVDNGSREPLHSQLFRLRHGRVQIMSMGRNIGVAAAQNVGIRIALNADFKFAILFDHDSLPAKDMIQSLVSTFESLTADGVRVAAVGPNYLERNLGLDAASLDGMAIPNNLHARHHHAIIRTDLIISSGCLISAEALRDVGLMREDLFIDHIDMEWCLRTVRKWRKGRRKTIETARSWKIFLDCEARMGHTLGDGHKKFWLGRKRVLPIKSPSRYYYITRNAVYLILRMKFPFWWKKSQAMTVIGALVFSAFGVFEDGRRLERAIMIVRGVWDGLCGRLGPIGTNPAKSEVVHEDSAAH